MFIHNSNKNITIYLQMFRKLHSEYADIVCNPFYIPGEPICSKYVCHSINII